MSDEIVQFQAEHHGGMVGAGLLMFAAIPLTLSYIFVAEILTDYDATMLVPGFTGVLASDNASTIIVVRTAAILLALLGMWLIVHAVAETWKGWSGIPDHTAHEDGIDFHPAIRPVPTSYDDILLWQMVAYNDSLVITIHFKQPFWSWQGILRRRTLRFFGKLDDIIELLNYFRTHPKMAALEQ